LFRRGGRGAVVVVNRVLSWLWWVFVAMLFVITLQGAMALTTPQAVYHTIQPGGSVTSSVTFYGATSSGVTAVSSAEILTISQVITLKESVIVVYTIALPADAAIDYYENTITLQTTTDVVIAPIVVVVQYPLVSAVGEQLANPLVRWSLVVLAVVVAVVSIGVRYYRLANRRLLFRHYITLLIMLSLVIGGVILLLYSNRYYYQSGTTATQRITLPFSQEGVVTAQITRSAATPQAADWVVFAESEQPFITYYATTPYRARLVVSLPSSVAKGSYYYAVRIIDASGAVTIVEKRLRVIGGV
jgi:hypothetical protein